MGEEDPGSDEAEFAIPSCDQGYVDVLNEKFGHEEFREGQLKAIKLILEKK